jgi:hypothetical protein
MRNSISAALSIRLLTSTAIVTTAIVTTAIVTASPNIAHAVTFKSVVHSVSHGASSTADTVKKGAESTEKNASKDVKSTTETVKKGTESTAKAAGKDLTHVGETTLKSSGVENVAKASTNTIKSAVENPKETAKALKKDAKGLERDAKTDANDLAHGNVKKLMKDTANQENAVDKGISKGTGVSMGTLKTINAINGGAMEKAAVEAAAHPNETLHALNKDAKGVEMAARTDAADIKSGNASKLLRDTTNQQNSLIAAEIKTEVALSGVPVPKAMVNAGVEYATTLNKMATGQGAAEIVEALAHGKNGAALLTATNDANTLQGNQILNSTNHVISKDTGISTAVLNTTEQVAMALAGGGEGAVASDAAKAVAHESVKAGSEAAVKAGEEAALKAAANGAGKAAAKDAASGVAKAAADDAAKNAGKTAVNDAAKDAGKRVAKTAAEGSAKEVTSAGAKEAAEVIPKGIVKERVAFFEGLGKAGTEEAANAAAAEVAKVTAKDAVRAVVEDAAKAKAEAAAGGAAKSAAKTAEKGGFDGAVKSRLTAAAEKAGKDAAEKGLDKAATKAAIEAAVKKEGENVAQETANLARYAVVSGGDPVKMAEAVANDAAGEAYKVLAGETEKGFVGGLKGLNRAALNLGDDETMAAAKAAAADYTSRMMGNARGMDPAIMTEVASRASAKMDKTFVADSLYAYMTDPMKGGMKLATTGVKEGAEPTIDKKLDKAEAPMDRKLDKAETAIQKTLEKAEK